MRTSSPIEVTVAMTTKNGEKFLAEQLQSIASLNNCHLNLIVVDSDSSDTTLELLQEWSNRISIKVLERNFKSTAESIHLLISLCPKNSFMAFSDQDDRWHSDKIAKTVSLENESTPTLYCSARNYIDEKGKYIGRSSKLVDEDLTISNALVENLAYGNTIILNPSGVKLAKSLFSLPQRHWDWYLYLIFCLKGRVKYLDDPTVDYRLHGTNQVGIRSIFDIRFAFFETKYKFVQSFKLFLKLEDSIVEELSIPLRKHFESILDGGFLDILHYLHAPLFRRVSKLDQFITKILVFIVWLEFRFIKFRKTLCGQ